MVGLGCCVRVDPGSGRVLDGTGAHPLTVALGNATGAALARTRIGDLVVVPSETIPELHPDRKEYFRSLPWNVLGAEGGCPPGPETLS